MRQAGTAGSVRLRVARLLLVCAFALCAVALCASMHSPGPMPAAPSLAMTPAEHGTVAAPASASASDFAPGGGNRAAEAKASVESPGQDTGCGCCAHDAATCCAATSEDPSPHVSVWACPWNQGGHQPAPDVAALFHTPVSRAAPPSLSELSLLRI